MASIISRNGKYAVIHYEGDDRHQVMKSGLTKAQAEKLKAKKDAEEKRWREQKKAQQKLAAADGRPMMPEQLNTKFKEVIVEMRESGYQFTSVAEDRLDDVVFHSVRAASATKKMQVSKGNIKAVMRAGGWAEPDMVIRDAKTYDQDQALIAEQMEKDAHKEGNTGASQETEELLQKILEHPEVLSQLIQALKP